MKHVLAIIDGMMELRLREELQQWAADLKAEGWSFNSWSYIPPSSAWDIKKMIGHTFTGVSAGDEVAIVLVGHVPAPPCYLGSRPDGHGAFGVAPADWWYACGDWPTTTLNGKEVLDVHITGGVVPSRPKYQIGRVDFRGLQFDALSENDAAWELDRLRGYFDKLHNYRTGATVPAQRGLAAEAGDWNIDDAVRMYLPPVNPTSSVAAAGATNLDQWSATAGTPPANPYRIAMYSPKTLNSCVKKIDATMVQIWHSFHWMQGNNKHVKAWLSDSPWTRNFIARNPSTLCAWWSGIRMDAETLHNGSSVGEAVRKANALNAACSLAGDPTVVLFPKE